jgi:hypothetical protein
MKQTLVDAYYRNDIDHYICDWCKQQMPADYFAGPCDRRNFELKCTTSNHYPEGGVEEGWQVAHMCNACADRLRVLLEKAGITVSEYEVDW